MNAIIRYILIFILFVTNSYFNISNSHAQDNINIVSLSESKSLPTLKGIRIVNDNELKIELIIDSFDKNNVNRDEVKQLVNYFLAGLSIKGKDIWVNLSPYERDRIMDNNLSRTDLGKDMLEQDLLLKKLSSSLTFPETETGKSYWQSINYSNLHKNKASKIWIRPDKAKLIEIGNTVLIQESSLKVESELKHQHLLFPELNRDINRGENFAKVRQMYNSLMLAKYIKSKYIKTKFNSIIDSNVTNGIEHFDKGFKEKIFNNYLNSVEQGTYNITKKEYDITRKQLVKRNYFCGGLSFDPEIDIISLSNSSAINSKIISGKAFKANLTIEALSSSAIEVENKQFLRYSNEIDDYQYLSQEEIEKLATDLQNIKKEIVSTILFLDLLSDSNAVYKAREGKKGKTSAAWLYDQFIDVYQILEYDKSNLNLEPLNLLLSRYADKRNEISLSYTRFVKARAKRFMNRGLSLNDLIQEGNRGLLRAIDTYLPESKNAFLAYAMPWIDQKIQLALKDHKTTVRIPANKQDNIALYKEAIAKGWYEPEFKPKTERQKKALKLKKQKNFNEIVELSNFSMSSLDKPVYEDQEGYTRKLDLLEDDDALAIDLLIQSEHKKALNAVIDSLEAREAEIIRLYYGINKEKLTLDEIGELLNITRERVRQIRNRAEIKLKKKIINNPNGIINGGIEFDIDLDIKEALSSSSLSDNGFFDKIDKFSFKITDIEIIDFDNYIEQ